MAFCIRCGEWFDDGGEDWKTLCLDCWKQKKNAETGNDGLVTYWRQRALKAETLLDLQANLPDPKPAFPSDLLDHLRTLIFLCHPDKHGNDPRATAATQYLLSLRDMLP